MSIRRVLIRLFACAAVAWTSADLAHSQLREAVQRFDEATEHYAAGNYRDAVAAFEDVLAAGYATGAVYYNAGNAYFRIDEYGQALRHWQKARRVMGDDPALVHNMDIVRARIGAPFSSVPPPFWVIWWQRVVVPIGTLSYLVLGLLLYVAAAVLYGIRIWTNTRSAWQRRARLGSLVLGLMLLMAAFGTSASRTSVTAGVVIAKSAKLADTLGDPGALDVPEGVLVGILGRESTHFRVKLPNGVVGYLPEMSVGEI